MKQQLQPSVSTQLVTTDSGGTSQMPRCYEPQIPDSLERLQATRYSHGRLQVAANVLKSVSCSFGAIILAMDS
jgi:hypothetical protein